MTGCGHTRRDWYWQALAAVILSAFVGASCTDGWLGGGDDAPQNVGADAGYVDVGLSAAGYTPVRSYRRLDTRGFGSRLGARDTVCIDIGGRDGIPASATAVAIHVTAVGPTGPGFLTVFPKGEQRPTASNLNYHSGAVNNAVLVGLGNDASLCIYSLKESHIIVDVDGYFDAASDYEPVVAFRPLDTRDAGSDSPAADSSHCIQVAGVGDVPANAKAVALNVTSVSPSEAGFLRAFPRGSLATTSTVNFGAGDTVANTALVEVGDDGEVCVYQSGKAHVVVDVMGYFGAGPGLVAMSPKRHLDTRNHGTRLSAGETRCLPVSGHSGVPTTAAVASMNITVVAPTGPGHLIVFPEGTARPATAQVNHRAGKTTAGRVLAPLGPDGHVCVYSHASADLVIDIDGFWQGLGAAVFPTTGSDYNLTKRCVKGIAPSQANYFEDTQQCSSTTPNWTIAAQAEHTLQISCAGPASQSLPINAGGALSFAWAPHVDALGRPNQTAILKSNFIDHAHPCGPGGHTWYAFMDHSGHGGLPLPQPHKLAWSSEIWYDDWAPNGSSRVIAGWSGGWDGKGVIVEVNLASVNWENQFPATPELVQKVNHPNLQWVELDGAAIGLGIPRRQGSEVYLPWHEIIQLVIDRGWVIPPSQGLSSAVTTGVSIATEVGNYSHGPSVSAELRVSDFRVLSR